MKVYLIIGFIALVSFGSKLKLNTEWKEEGPPECDFEGLQYDESS